MRKRLIMKRLTITSIIAAVTLCACSSDPATVVGRVSCEGKGLKGVVVSDGIEVVTTNWRGQYKMASDKANGYVFISIPSGYEVATEGLLPKHYVRIGANDVDTADFELVKVNQDKFTLIVNTDIHLNGDSVDRDVEQFHDRYFPDLCKTASEVEGPLYTLCLGDMSTDAKWKKNKFGLPEYLKEMEGYRGPIFHVMGNHDNQPKGQGTVEEWISFIGEKNYKETIGPDYYSMNIGQVHFAMLDNIMTLGPETEKRDAKVAGTGFGYAFDQEQLDWLAKDLSYVDKEKPLVMCCHVPLYTTDGIDSEGNTILKERKSVFQTPDALLDLVKDFKEVHFLCGHYHCTETFPIAENIINHTVGSAGAVSWKINDLDMPMICSDGTAGGFQIFKVDGDEISWQLKSTYDSIEKSQMRIYDLNTLPVEYGGEPESDMLLVNVFNWDPEWTVEASEEGTALEVTRVAGHDPLYKQIRTETKTLLHRPTAFLTTVNAHMFKVKRTDKDKKVTITVTDRFGNVYVEEV